MHGLASGLMLPSLACTLGWEGGREGGREGGEGGSGDWCPCCEFVLSAGEQFGDILVGRGGEEPVGREQRAGVIKIFLVIHSPIPATHTLIPG